MPIDPLLLAGGIALVDLQAAQADVGHAVKRERVRRQAVAAGTSDFLVIAFDIGRHVGVKNEADIRLVDPHAEGDGRHHDNAILLQEEILIARAVGPLHAGMIRQRLDAALAQDIGEFVSLAPRSAIDDTGLPFMLLDEIGDLLASAGFCLHRQAQVWPIEAVHEHRRRAREQLFNNIRARRGIGSRGERHGLHAAKLRLRGAERRVFRAKVMAPLRDAMRFVDREQRGVRAFENIKRL